MMGRKELIKAAQREELVLRVRYLLNNGFLVRALTEKGTYRVQHICHHVDHGKIDTLCIEDEGNEYDDNDDNVGEVIRNWYLPIELLIGPEDNCERIVISDFNTKIR